MTIWRRKLRYRFASARHTQNPKRRQRCFCTMIAGSVLLLFAGFFFFAELRIGEIAQESALSSLNSVVVKEVNRLVEVVLDEKQGNTPLIVKERDSEGNIIAMNTDHKTLNRIKSALSIEVQKSMDNFDTIETNVPIGMLVSDTLMTGFGVRVPIHVYVNTDVVVEFEDTFEAAGINQTRYQLMVTVTVPAQVVGVFHSKESEITTQVPIAETILVGEVPQTYLQGEL